MWRSTSRYLTSKWSYPTSSMLRYRILEWCWWWWMLLKSKLKSKCSSRSTYLCLLGSPTVTVFRSLLKKAHQHQHLPVAAPN